MLVTVLILPIKNMEHHLTYTSFKLILDNFLLEKYFLIKDSNPLFSQLPLSIQVKRYDGVHLDITTQEYIANYLYKFLQEEIE